MDLYTHHRLLLNTVPGRGSSKNHSHKKYRKSVSENCSLANLTPGGTSAHVLVRGGRKRRGPGTDEEVEKEVEEEEKERLEHGYKKDYICIVLQHCNFNKSSITQPIMLTSSQHDS